MRDTDLKLGQIFTFITAAKPASFGFVTSLIHKWCPNINSSLVVGRDPVINIFSVDELRWPVVIDQSVVRTYIRRLVLILLICCLKMLIL